MITILEGFCPIINTVWTWTVEFEANYDNAGKTNGVMGIWQRIGRTKPKLRLA